MPFAAVAPFLLAGMNVAGNLFGAHQQQRNNMRLARYQANKNMELLKYQLDYNAPSAQMQRFKDAGLNPNLMYGQGSAGNWDSPQKYPDIQPANYQAALSNLGTQVQQARLMSSQADLNYQKKDESGIKQDLMKAQKDLVKANPYLDANYMNALINNMVYSTSIKESQSMLMNYQAKTYDQATGYSIGEQKINADLQLLEQRFKLNQADLKVKAQIIQSKDFENALKEIQVNWMKNKEITPQHIYMGIMLLLQKLL